MPTPEVKEIITQLLSIILGSGALFGILQFTNDLKKRKDGAEYLATRIAILLEGYAINCANKISEFDLVFSTDGIMGELIHDISNLPEIPEGEYKLLDRSLLDEFLQLPQEIEIARSACLSECDFADLARCGQIRIRYITIIGAKAYKLAYRVRKKYKLPQRTIRSGKLEIKDVFQNI